MRFIGEKNPNKVLWEKKSLAAGSFGGSEFDPPIVNSLQIMRI